MTGRIGLLLIGIVLGVVTFHGWQHLVGNGWWQLPVGIVLCANVGFGIGYGGEKFSMWLIRRDMERDLPR